MIGDNKSSVLRTVATKITSFELLSTFTFTKASELMSIMWTNKVLLYLRLLLLLLAMAVVDETTATIAKATGNRTGIVSLFLAQNG